MNLFREDGHFTKEGLQAVIKDSVSALQALEASEHLSFCDACLEQYTALLTDDVLVEPSAPLRPAVQKRLHKTHKKLLLRKYAAIAAAACFAIGIFSVSTFITPQSSGGTNAPSSQKPSLGENLNQAAGGVGSFFDNLFGNLFQSSQSGPPFATSDRQRTEENKEREKVFEREKPLDNKTPNQTPNNEVTSNSDK